MADIYYDDPQYISNILQEHKVILCPTDTVLGLSADAFSEESVERIFEMKNRDRSKPLILLVDSVAMLKLYTVGLHPRVENLLLFHDRPLTLIHKVSNLLPEYLVSDQGTIAIRVIQNHILTEIITLLGNPIVSTSANLSGEPIVDRIEHVDPAIKSKVDYVLKDQGDPQTKPSVIARYDDEGNLEFLRE